jgi:hypothetical protein
MTDRFPAGGALAMPPRQRRGKLRVALTIAGKQSLAGDVYGAEPACRAFAARPKGERHGRTSHDYIHRAVCVRDQYFGWEDAGGRVQLALFSAFLFGIICGYRVKK